MAAEGRPEPFYWRCVEDACFTCNMDQPFPMDGVLRCRSCPGDVAVEFGEWGDRFAWRCTENSRHRFPVARSHLKLPKMAALIPAKARRALEATGGSRRAARGGRRKPSPARHKKVRRSPKLGRQARLFPDESE